MFEIIRFVAIYPYSECENESNNARDWRPQKIFVLEVIHLGVPIIN